MNTPFKVDGLKILLYIDSWMLLIHNVVFSFWKALIKKTKCPVKESPLLFPVNPLLENIFVFIQRGYFNAAGVEARAVR